MDLDFQKVQSAKTFAPATSKGGRNVQSITLTYTEVNGKRVTLSNSLMATLNLTDNVYIGLIVDDRKILLSNHPVDGADALKISKRNIYNANAVLGIIEAFGLQPIYEKHTSHTFKDIEVYADNGIAIVTVPVVEGE